jgi:hypothetical protein
MAAHEDALLLAELEALEKEEQRRNRYSEWVPHHPHPKQDEFLRLDCLEALFGGAAGGGKSDALLMAALQYVDRPNYAALVLRRTFKDLNLPGAIMARSHEWLRGSRAAWSEKDKTWTFPSGATLTFGYLDTEQDKYRYQGAELQFLGLDEATQFPENWYRYLLSRLRRAKGSDIPIRARLGSNPGGIGHAWVHNRFVLSGDDQRIFVPSLLTDNPHLDQEEYRRSLALLDSTTRRQLEDGIWVQDASGLVYRKPLTIKTRPHAAEENWAYLLGMDFGIKDATAYVVLGWRKNDRSVYVLESFKQSGMTVTEAAEKVHELQKQYPFSKVVGDLGGMGKAFGEEFQRRWGIPIEAAQKTNKRGYIGLLNGASERRELVIVEPTNTALLKELAELPWSDESHQKEADGFDNHLTDALLYAWRATTAYSQPLAVAPITDPLDVIRKQTAAIWSRYEEDLRRSKAEEQSDDYDVGDKFFGQEDW